MLLPFLLHHDALHYYDEPGVELFLHRHKILRQSLSAMSSGFLRCPFEGSLKSLGLEDCVAFEVNVFKESLLG